MAPETLHATSEDGPCQRRLIIRWRYSKNPKMTMAIPMKVERTGNPKVTWREGIKVNESGTSSLKEGSIPTLILGSETLLTQRSRDTGSSSWGREGV